MDELDRRDLARALLGGAAAAALLDASDAYADRGRDEDDDRREPRRIEDFWRPGDGARDDPATDWLPVIMRAQATRPIITRTEVTETGTRTIREPLGFTLLFGPRDYRFSGTIHLIRSMSLVGSGGSEGYAGTRFVFPRDTAGIVADSFWTAEAAGLDGGGSWSILDRLQIIGEEGTSPDAHGVILKARIKITNVLISHFTGNGVHIEADVTQRPISNANGWLLDYVRITKCNHGVYLRGGDANAGAAFAVDIANCRGWGIHDSSFLGNTFVACQVQGCRAGGYRADGANARSLFLNCYTEGDTPAAHIAPPSMSVGGFMQVNGGGGAIDMGGGTLRFPNGCVIPNAADPNKVVLAQFGEKVPATAMTLVDPVTPWWPYRLRFGAQHPGWWELNWALADFQTPLRFSTRAADVGSGQVWMENGYHVGRTTARVHVTAAPGPPSEGTFHLGDQVLNSAPEPGGFAGWIYTSSGWRGFGRIE